MTRTPIWPQTLSRAGLASLLVLLGACFADVTVSPGPPPTATPSATPTPCTDARPCVSIPTPSPFVTPSPTSPPLPEPIIAALYRIDFGPGSKGPFGPGSKGPGFGPGSKGISQVNFDVLFPPALLRPDIEPFRISNTHEAIRIDRIQLTLVREQESFAVITLLPKQTLIAFSAHLPQGQYQLLARAEGNFYPLAFPGGSLQVVEQAESDVRIEIHARELAATALDIAVLSRVRPLIQASQ